MKLLFFFLCLLTTSAFAFDNPYIMRSPRGLLMGDAFTAVNDDEFTLFYNPASMARHKNDFTLYPFNPQFSGTNVLKDYKSFQNFPKDPVGASKLLMDYPAHASVGIAPGFKMFNVGVNFIASQSYDVLLRNRAHPMLDLDLRSDKGLIFGVGLPLGPGRINKKSTSGQMTSLGLGAKYIQRTGIADTLALTGPTVVDSLSKKDLQSILNSLGQVKGQGWGFDAGLEHVVKSGANQFVVGLSALDIGNTTFRVPANTTPTKVQVANNRSQVNLGLATGANVSGFHYTLSSDLRALNEDMDFGKRVRLGAEVGIPGISVMGGINSGYYSYGATLNLGIMKFTAGFYEVELGTKYKQIRSSRLILYLSLFDFSFDA